jgi:succinoglycan biosynthesis protein ExoM
MKKELTPNIDVCIATYKRPLLLEKLIKSLIRQETDNLFTFSLTIVDNDQEQSAKKTIKNMTVSPIAISYYCQPIKNISLTRNLAVTKSAGKYLAFIDDDEHACKDWLLNLFLCLKKYEADCVRGPVISCFPIDTPKWLIRSGFLNRKRFKTGTSIYVGSTNNCLISFDVINQFAIPFDPEFGLTGGEDTAFFSKIIARGHRMIWCDEAEVHEYVSRDRATLKWLLLRSFRVGNTYIIQKNKKNQLVNKIINLNVSLAKFTIVLFISPLCLIPGFFKIKLLLKPVTKLTEYCGQIAAFWGYHYKEYR